MPITGKSKPAFVTFEDILKKITEFDIYTYFCPIKFKLGVPFSNPMRIDQNPSFVIKVSKESGYIYHLDFVYPEYTGNSAQFVQQLYKINYNEALTLIDQEFGLGLSPNSVIKDYRAITSKYEQPSELALPPFIAVIPRPFTSEEARYWNDYHISADKCRQYEIFAIRSLYINGSRVTNPMNRLRFAYRYEYEGKELWKIYTPLIQKECGYKWFTNVPISVMEGLDKLDPNKDKVITKSRKDLMITREFIPNSCASQNESSVAISQTNIELLQQGTGNNFIFFDNDDAGVKASKFYTDTYNFKYLNIPRKFLDLRNVKDISDLSKAFGLKKCEEFFKIKGLL